MAKLNKNHNEYDRLSYSHLDNNEAFGYYYKLQKPVYKLDVNSVSGETLTLSAGAAGTTGLVPVANIAAILNADGSSMGYYNSASDKDSSFAIASGTALVKEVKFNKVFDKSTILSALANGEFAIDYVNGVIYYKKFDASTSVTCNYKYWDSSVSFSGTIGDVTSNGKNIATEDTLASIETEVTTELETHYNAAADETPVALKASAGKLHYVNVYNPNAYDVRLQLFNIAAASVVLGTTPIRVPLRIPAQGYGWIDLNTKCVGFDTAMSYAITKTDNTSALDTDAEITIFYR